MVRSNTALLVSRAQLMRSGPSSIPKVSSPTNNAAERILRRAVLWRKASFGTDSPKGSRFVERILTVVTTLRLQNRNVLDYITTAYQAHLCRAAAPSLLSD